MAYITRSAKWKVSYLFFASDIFKSNGSCYHFSCDPFRTLNPLQKKNGMIYLFIQSFKLSSIHDMDFPSSISGIKSSFFVPLSSYSSHLFHCIYNSSITVLVFILSQVATHIQNLFKEIWQIFHRAYKPNCSTFLKHVSSYMFFGERNTLTHSPWDIKEGFQNFTPKSKSGITYYWAKT